MKEILLELMVKRLSGELSPMEEQALEEMLAADAGLREEAALWEEVWRISGVYGELVGTYQPDERMGWEVLQSHLAAARKEQRRRVLWRWLGAAAVLLLLFVGGYRLFILEGKEAVVLVAKTELETKTLRLPDGSVVHLAPATELKYPESFLGERRVQLEGEAYFQVEKEDSKRPFVVEGQRGQVKVLGTRFLYRTRRSEGIDRVLLEEGKVVYQLEQGGVFVELFPGEALVYDLAKASVEKVSFNPNYLFWQTGRLVFRGEPLSEVLDELEDLFGVHFDRAGIESILACRQTLAFNGQPSLGDILEVLQSHLHWDMERDADGVWHLHGGRCE